MSSAAGKKSRKFRGKKSKASKKRPNVERVAADPSRRSCVARTQTNEIEVGVELNALRNNEKSTECRFEEFGDFWPYMSKSALPDREDDRKFYFMLAFPQFLRTPNRKYLEQLKKRYLEESEKEARPKPARKIPENFSDARKKAETFEREFQAAELKMKTFPNYYRYLKSHYITKHLNPFGSKKRLSDFKNAIVSSGKQKAEYLAEMERVFQFFFDTYSND